jgi:hypothetical protein
MGIHFTKLRLDEITLLVGKAVLRLGAMFQLSDKARHDHTWLTSAPAVSRRLSNRQEIEKQLQSICVTGADTVEQLVQARQEAALLLSRRCRTILPEGTHRLAVDERCQLDEEQTCLTMLRKLLK